jgi:S-adenosylmethionine/arginine decarboxylase-like enzyme
MAQYWGIHLLLDCSGCDLNAIKDESVLKNFLSELVTKIDMKAYGQPILAHFATHDPSKGGYTVVQMIETSLIDGHFVDNTGEAYISVHSCKDFDEKIVKDVVMKYFKPDHIKSTVFHRKA